MKKVRKYHYEAKFGVDQFSMRIFVAIKRKLERDYLPFINSLQKLYTRGEVKDQLNDFHSDVNDMLSIVSQAIEDNDLPDANAKDLVILSQSVEEGKQWFEAQVAANKAFRGKLQKVEAETGIGPKHLTITPNVVSQGSVQAKKQTKEGFFPWANRVAPKTMASLAMAGKGAATGLLGPYSGMLGMFSDVSKLGTQATRKYTQKRQSKAAGSIRAKMPPRAPEFGPRANFSGGMAYSSSGSGRRGFRGGPEKLENTPLWRFFNKEAYRAKWTKELLATMKRSAQQQRAAGGGGGGLTGAVGTGVSGALGGAAAVTVGRRLIPAAKTAGGALGVAAAGGFAGYEAYRASKAEVELRKANKRARAALDELTAFSKKEIERIRRAGGLEAYSKKAGETPRQIAMNIASRERWVAQKKWETRSPWKKVLGISSFFKKPEMEPFYDRVAELEKELSTTRAMSQSGATGGIPSRDAIVEELKSIKRNTQPKSNTVLGSGGPRNMHDSGDVMINQFLLQGLTIGGE